MTIISDIELLRSFVSQNQRLFLLTGAGCSTASGIPDYRDQYGDWKRRQPVRHQAFLISELVRARYWARSMIGWPLLSCARPNATHLALAELEVAGRVSSLVTQNVDGLHQKAGSRKVMNLHGGINSVVCMQCGTQSCREALQQRLESANEQFLDVVGQAAPDGDADLDSVDFSGFQVPVCLDCGGMLKPDVVFFGANVPTDRVERAMKDLEASDAVLIVGSSLMVYSGYRFAVRAAKLNKPIAAVNLGKTRADDLLALKIERDCVELMPDLLRRIVRTADSG